MKTKPMNTSVIRAPVALLISAGLLLLVAGTQGSDPGRGLERDTPGGGRLEGAWNVTVNICNNGPTLTRLNTFMFGGTMQEYAAFVSPPLVSPRGPGHGVWEHLTDGHYSYTVKFFVFNADGTLAGWRIEMRDVVVDVSGSSYTATGTSQLYDVNGNPVGPPVCATETATRFQ
jgi:hypothetical protein